MYLSYLNVRAFFLLVLGASCNNVANCTILTDACALVASSTVPIDCQCGSQVKAPGSVYNPQYIPHYNYVQNDTAYALVQR